jgi:hypothetical protein
MNGYPQPAMKKKILLLSFAFLVCLSAVTYSVRAQTEPTPTPPTTTPGIPGTTPMHRRHPAIRAAIRALERAKAEMLAAADDYGGHKEDAITACDTAISQLKLALQYASQAGASSPAPTPTP